MSTIQFYRVDYWHTDFGPLREHYSTKREAIRRAKNARFRADTDIEVWHHRMPADKASILEALNHSSNIGAEGFVGLPGDCSLVETFAAQHDDND